MPMYQEGRWEPIMDLLEEALLNDESDAFLKDPDGYEIHKLLVKHNRDTKFSVYCNELSMGGDYTMGEAYDLIVNCIDSREPAHTY